MDDLLLRELGKSLFSLEKCAGLLDDLLVPRQACSGENAGKAPKHGKSRPPVQLGIVDLKAETQRVVCGWSARLAVSCSVDGLPPGRGIAERAGWLQSHLVELESMAWGELAASQIVAQAQLVVDVVAPVEDEVAPIEVGGPAEVASWARHLGARVSSRTVYRWAADGVIPSATLPDGRMAVRLCDVMEKAGQNSFLVSVTKLK